MSRWEVRDLIAAFLAPLLDRDPTTDEITDFEIVLIRADRNTLPRRGSRVRGQDEPPMDLKRLGLIDGN